MKKRSAQDQELPGTGIRPKEWSAEELAQVKAFIKAHNAKRAAQRKLKK